MTDGRNVDTVLAGDEKDLMILFLQNQRDTLLWTVSGLTCEQLQMTLPPSTLTLIGLVKHLTRVERSWLQEDLLGPDIDSFVTDTDEWALGPRETCDGVIEDYRVACQRSDEIVRELSLDTVLVDPHPLQAGLTLRWAMMHMIEETARHLGQADLIRESIDGMVGQNQRFP